MNVNGFARSTHGCRVCVCVCVCLVNRRRGVTHLRTWRTRTDDDGYTRAELGASRAVVRTHAFVEHMNRKSFAPSVHEQSTVKLPWSACVRLCVRGVSDMATGLCMRAVEAAQHSSVRSDCKLESSSMHACQHHASRTRAAREDRAHCTRAELNNHRPESRPYAIALRTSVCHRRCSPCRSSS